MPSLASLLAVAGHDGVFSRRCCLQESGTCREANDVLEAKCLQHSPQAGTLLSDSGSQDLLQRAWEVTGRREESLAGTEREEGTCEGPEEDLPCKVSVN